MGLSKHVDAPTEEFSGNTQQKMKWDPQQSLKTLEAMMLYCAIDVKEGRYVVITDITSGILHADM